MVRTVLLALIAAFLPAALAAQGHGDHDRAHAARNRGEIVPLAEILPGLEATLGGRVIEVDFEEEDGRPVYEFELITPAGRLLEAEVDATTGDVIEVEVED